MHGENLKLKGIKSNAFEKSIIIAFVQNPSSSEPAISWQTVTTWSRMRTLVWNHADLHITIHSFARHVLGTLL